MEELCDKIVKAALEVHRVLGGPGLLENIYESALVYELSLQGIRSQRQVPVPVIYKSVEVREAAFLDILVEKEVILELKATPKDFPFYKIQLSSYLRLTRVPRGILINFGKDDLLSGICHVVNTHNAAVPIMPGC